MCSKQVIQSGTRAEVNEVGNFNSGVDIEPPAVSTVELIRERLAQYNSLAAVSNSTPEKKIPTLAMVKRFRPW